MSRSDSFSDGRRNARTGTFAPTRWTLVLRARESCSPQSLKALSELCEAYYSPVLAFIWRGAQNEDAARDLTQEFFRRLLARPGLAGVTPERGRFRSYLLGAVKHFLAEERDRANASKRGGGRRIISLEAGAGFTTTSELQIPDPAGGPSDTVFDRNWAATLVDRAAGELAKRAREEGREAQFAVLKPWLMGESPSLSLADAAAQLGMSDGAVKVAVHRLRRRFREIVKAEIAHTVSDRAQVTDELRYLIQVLAQ